MPPIERLPADQAIKQMRDHGHIPLAILCFDVTRDQFFMALLEDVDKDEVNALLDKIGLRFVTK